MDFRKFMAVAAANLRFLYRLLDEFTKRSDTDTASQAKKLVLNHPIQHHVGAGIGSGYAWHRTILAQVWFPIMGRGLAANQPAFFLFATTKIVAVKIRAFNPGWCAHFASVL